MLDSNKIKKNYNNNLVELSELVVRDVKDRTEDGDIVVSPELQFQVKTLDATIEDLSVDVNYFTASGEFLGCDSDLRLEPLKAGEVHSFSILLEPPEHVDAAELTVDVRRQRLADRIPFVIKMAFILAICVVVFYLNSTD